MSNPIKYPRGESIGLRFTSNQNFDFASMTGNQGAHGVSIRNTGNTVLLIDSKKVGDRVLPGETWVNRVAIAEMRRDFHVSFDKTGVTSPQNEAVLWYMISKEC